MNQNMRKRERAGEPLRRVRPLPQVRGRRVCQICGHRMAGVAEKVSSIQVSAFPTEILAEFLYLGSYDNASRAELLKTQGISRVLNLFSGSGFLAGFAIRNLSAFVLHWIRSARFLCIPSIDDEECERDRARVLVHCMTGKSRSPAIVMAYLMKSKRMETCTVLSVGEKNARPSVELTQGVYQQLQDYERRCLSRSRIASLPCLPSLLPPRLLSALAFPKPSEPASAPTFNTSRWRNFHFLWASSRHSSPQKFTFGAGHTQNNVSQKPTCFEPKSK
nr:protein-tyrosine-phosphatase IBR5-like [Ipomoea batatas]